MSPACGHLGQPEDHHGRSRAGLRHPLALVVLERTDAAERLAHDDDVADLERAGLHERGRDRTAALVELRFDDRADGRSLRVRLELLEVRDEQQDLDQLVEPDARLRRHRHERHVAAELLDDDASLGQLGLHPVGVRIRLVDLVEGDDDRDLRRLGVADGLEGLGHDAVIGGHDDDRDVRDAGAAGAHRGERLVARRVQEHDALAVLDDLARADVLGDAAALAGRHLGRPDRVEQACLAVVDVAHDRDDGCARLEERRIVLLEQQLLGRLADGLVPGAVGAVGPVRVHGLGHFVAELARYERGGIAIDQLVDRREDAALDQFADHVRGVDREQVRELLDGDGCGQFDGSAFARIGDLDGPAAERAVAARRLARAASAAGAAPTPGHGLLLRCSVWSCRFGGLW